LGDACRVEVVGNSTVAALRMSTLGQQLAVKHKRAQVITAQAPESAKPKLVRNQRRRAVRMLRAQELPGLLRQCLASEISTAAKRGIDAPGYVLLAQHGDSAAIRYAIQRNLPCITGVAGLSEDNKFVITRACGSHLEWHIPIENKTQVWLLTPASVPSRLLLAGGRGAGEQGIAKMRRLASGLGGEIGLTRTAAQNGWGDFECLVGQSGRVANPEACVVFGASGAAAFMAGVEQAHTLIAVNTDPDAPIFTYADYGVIADAGTVLEHLLGAFA